jgi:membrane protease YdiL (CAAX protease family)
MTTELTRPLRSLRSVAQSVLLSISLLLLVLADVLAFNQFATQSATDAIVQIIVFAVGGAGLVEFLRRALCCTSAVGRWSAIVPGALSAGAFIAWHMQAPVGWLVIITITSAAFLGIIAVRSLWGPEDSKVSESAHYVGLFCLAQTIVLVYVAVLAAVDASSVLFP